MNPVLAGVILNQDAQLVMVGDSSQQLFSWRGAVDAMSTFDAPHRLSLTLSFRFGDAVAQEANRWLDQLDAPVRVRGSDIDSRVCQVDDPDVVLCRTNAQCIVQVVEAGERGKKVAIVGGTDAIERLAKAAIDLQARKPTSHPEFVGFSDWDEVREYSMSGEGSDLGVFVRLIEDRGAQGILEICSEVVPAGQADLTVSTVHKVKGLQWPKVKIGADFATGKSKNGESLARGEMMVNYVAVTRAQHELDLGGLAWVDEVESGPDELDDELDRALASDSLAD
jgi:hypothetical protein